jgi:chemotaxis signal transduction protein
MIAPPAPTALLQIDAGARTYLVAPHAVDWMRAYDAAQPPTHDPRGLPIVYANLAALLTNAAAPDAAGHLLGVQLRRRSVALIVRRIETLRTLDLQPLAPLLAGSLTRPWVLGVALCDTQPVIVLDLRRLAMDALAIV